MEQHIVCPNCGHTAATLTTHPAANPPDAAPATPSTVESFVDSECQLRTDGLIASAELYAAYHEWAEQVGFSPVTPKSFGMAVSQIPGVERRRTKDARMFTGITLKA